ncbi:MAG TPA: hypothetical protein VLM37_05615, partial [Fibrobacteraceae bacterium]|nr:hypothetical protein [Fibrobacteraceae bacterium]
ERNAVAWWRLDSIATFARLIVECIPDFRHLPRCECASQGHPIREKNPSLEKRIPDTRQAMPKGSLPMELSNADRECVTQTETAGYSSVCVES